MSRSALTVVYGARRRNKGGEERIVQQPQVEKYASRSSKLVRDPSNAELDILKQHLKGRRRGLSSFVVGLGCTKATIQHSLIIVQHEQGGKLDLLNRK